MNRRDYSKPMIDPTVLISAYIGTLLALLTALAPLIYMAKKKMENSIIGGFL